MENGNDTWIHKKQRWCCILIYPRRLSVLAFVLYILPGDAGTEVCGNG